ncbi:MAG: pyridoxamine kinase [Lachnospiraceae bacterium]|nr:pyridoxamine kinase [Lachnospiraceae bacterium]
MTKKIAVINDLSGFGRCSLTAALPVLAVMGVQPCPLPTAVLTAQTGYPSYYCDDFTDRMKYFCEEWEKMQVSFDGIYTGFVASEQQIENIFQFLDSFHTKDTFLLVDPVMGDDGEVYKMFTPGLCQKMKDLVKRADIITPNVTELCLLTDMSYASVMDMKKQKERIQVLGRLADELLEQGLKTVIVTGIRYEEDGILKMGNLAVDKEKKVLTGYPVLGCSYSGTGDLFASVVTGGIARGDQLEEIIKEAGDFLSRAIQDSSKEGIPGTDGVNFEKFLGMLIKK